MVALVRWRQRSREVNDSRWRQFGRFLALSSLVGIFGVMVYVARIGNLEFMYRSRLLERLSSPSIEELQLRASFRSRWHISLALFLGLKPFELCFATVAYMLVLYRMLQLAVVSSTHERPWTLSARVVLAVMVAANVIGICGNVAAAVFFFQAAEISSKEAEAWAMNDTATALTFNLTLSQKRTLGTSTAAVQRFCQVFVMLGTVAAFSVVVWNFRRFTLSSLRALFMFDQKLQQRTMTNTPTQGLNNDQSKLVADAISNAKQLQYKVTLTFGFTFIAALLRSFYDVLYAVAQSLNDNQNPCSLSPCDACHNVFSNLHGWLVFTPEFETCVMIIASPAALLIALWGMSDVHEIEQMSSPAAKLRYRMRQLRTQI